MAKPYTREEYDADRREIVSQIRKYNPLSIAWAALSYVNAPTTRAYEAASRQPWLAMLLVKWVYLDPMSISALPRPPIDEKGLINLLQRMHALSEKACKPQEYDDARLLMRALAFQQFHHQTEDGLLNLARQELIFGKVADNHYFRIQFLSGTGVSVRDFVRLSFALISFITLKGAVVRRDSLFDLCSAFSPATIDYFLNLISVDHTHLHKKLKAIDNDDRHPDEYFHQTPFIRFPLIKVSGEYGCLSKHILHRSLGHFVYDYLKRDDINNFNNPFGKSFERYVGNCIKKAGLPTADEQELINVLPGQGKVVDFLVADGSTNVLIDAKGVEMAQRGMTAARRQEVRRATQTSLIKAFEQGHDVAARMGIMDAEHCVIKPRSATYLLAVTYKELYIGNGLSLAAVAGSEHLDSIRAKYDPRYLIPNENIYFLTIHEFERLMRLVEGGHIGLAEVLERAKCADSDPQTHKFNFELHLNAFTKDIMCESHLRNDIRSIIADVRETMLGNA